MTYGSYGVMAAYLMGGKDVNAQLCHFTFIFTCCKGEVVAADNFTTKANRFSENIRGADWPKWHWINVE
jgi:hypothetical protein